MKKILAIMLTVALVMSLGAVTALAAPTYDVTGVLVTSSSGHVTGTLSGTAYTLDVIGQVSEYAENSATFSGTVSGTITGTITASINSNGIDTLSGTIVSDEETYRITGIFPKSGTKGDFKGNIFTGPAPTYVESMSILGDSSVAVGSTIQLSIDTQPTGSSNEVVWSVWTAPDTIGTIGTIDENTGVLTGLKTGTLTVIAKALDGSLKDATKLIEVVNPETEVVAAVDPTYIIVIPAAVNLGTLQKGVAVTPQTFNVSAQDVLIEAGKSIKVKVASSFLLKSGSAELVYQLLSGSDVLETGDTFATFTGVATQNGSVQVPSTNGITTAGIYQDTMVFSISYE